MSTGDGDLDAVRGTPFTLALAAAREAATGADAARIDALFARAVARAPDQLRPAVALEHVVALRTAHSMARAAQRCAEHLRRDPESIALRLQTVEIDVVRERWAGVDDAVVELRRATGPDPEHWVQASLSRLEGLAAAQRGDLRNALRRLERAQRAFRAIGHAPGVRVVDQDIRLVRLRTSGPAPDPQIPPRPDRTPHERLLRSEELRLGRHYELAWRELEPAVDGPLDRELRFRFVQAAVRLLRLLRDDRAADERLPELYAAAADADDPVAAEAESRRLDPHRPAPPTPPPTGVLGHVRRLVGEGRLEEAEQTLQAEPASADAFHRGEWHLAAGELALACAERDGDRGAGRQAVGHLAESLRHLPDEPPHLRVAALRGLGDAHAAGGDAVAAVEAWAGAHRIEEQLAGVQPSDGTRIRMLRAAADELDAQVDVAGRAAVGGEPAAAAAVVVAMEAARSKAIVPRALHRAADLPAPSDRAGARRWIRRAVRGLPRDQLVWMLHVTPGYLHHVFVGRDLVEYRRVACRRDDLSAAIDAVLDVTRDGGLWAYGRSGPAFGERLAVVAALMGLGILDTLPARVTRLAVVAGGELADVPFAALPCATQPGATQPGATQPGATQPGATQSGVARPEWPLVGLRFALSDLPCLALRRPLRVRARRNRGRRPRQMLLLSPAAAGVHPQTPGLTGARSVPGRTELGPAESTPGALRAALATGHVRHLRIDGHAKFHGDASRSRMQLAPDGPSGQLSPDDLGRLPLDRCGTVVLGSCESGMVTRIGRDERTGFVRTALLAGAASVVAARWVAEDTVAAALLDDLEEHLRRHPRDVALWMAMRATHEAGGVRADPAWWAPWTLYGDAGHQCRFGRLRAVLRFRPGPDP